MKSGYTTRSPSKVGGDRGSVRNLNLPLGGGGGGGGGSGYGGPYGATASTQAPLGHGTLASLPTVGNSTLIGAGQTMMGGTMGGTMGTGTIPHSLSQTLNTLSNAQQTLTTLNGGLINGGGGGDTYTKTLLDRVKPTTEVDRTTLKSTRLEHPRELPRLLGSDLPRQGSKRAGSNLKAEMEAERQAKKVSSLTGMYKSPTRNKDTTLLGGGGGGLSATIGGGGRDGRDGRGGSNDKTHSASNSKENPHGHGHQSTLKLPAVRTGGFVQ